MEQEFVGIGPLPFWYVQERGATEEEIADAEAYLGHALPDALRDLLKQQNGGVSNYAEYREGDTYCPMLPLFGVDPDAAADTLMRAFDVRDDFGVPEGVVVFGGLGHAWMGLDYRANPQSPSVVYRNDLDSPIEAVAPSFIDFLRGLFEE